MNAEKWLSPGRYSVFVLNANSTWEQPTYLVGRGWTEARLADFAARDCGGFIAYGVAEDPDCPEGDERSDLGDDA